MRRVGIGDDHALDRRAADIIGPLPATAMHHVGDHLADHRTTSTFDQRCAPAIVGNAPRIGARTAVKGIEVAASRTQSPKPVLIEPFDTPRSLDPREGMQPLTEHQFATGTPGKGVDVLMRVAGTETGEDDFPRIGPIIAVGGFEVYQGGPFAQINPAMPQGKTGRHIELIGKDRFLIRPSVAVGVFQNQQYVVRHVVRFELWISPRAEYPQPPAGIEADRDRIGDPVAFVGKQVHFKTVGHFERGHFALGRNIGLRLLNALCVGSPPKNKYAEQGRRVTIKGRNHTKTHALGASA